MTGHALLDLLANLSSDWRHLVFGVFLCSVPRTWTSSLQTYIFVWVITTTYQPKWQSDAGD